MVHPDTLTATRVCVPSRRPRLGLALLAVPSLLIAIDITGLSVALPRMAADLQPSPAELLWMNDIYGFMVGGVMITMGGLGDRIGRRRLIVLSSAVFAVASAAAAFSGAPWMIIAARAVMGVAGAGIMPASMALIRELFPDPQQAVSALGAYMTCFLAGMAIAPLIGGLLVEIWWWGAVFLLGVPIMLLTVIGAPRLLPEARDPTAHGLDLTSAALSLAAILALVYALKAAVSSGWSVSVFFAAASGVLLGWLFLRRQQRLPDPLVDLGLFRRRDVRRAGIVLFLTALVMGGSSLFVTFYLQSVQGLTPFVAAMWLLPQMLAMIAASNLGPWLGHRFEPARVVLTSLVLMSAGFLFYAVLPPGPIGLPVLAAAAMLATGGVGAAFPYLMSDIMTHAPAERAGSAASVAQSFNELGIATGLAVLGSIGTIAYRLHLTGHADSSSGSWVDGFAAAATSGDHATLDRVRRAFTAGFHTAGLTALLIMGIVLVLRLPPPTSTPAAAPPIQSDRS